MIKPRSLQKDKCPRFGNCHCDLADPEMNDNLAMDGQELRFLRLLLIWPTLVDIKSN